MSEIDYVLKNIKVTEKDTQIDFKKFYQFLNKLLVDNGYFVMEKEYINKLKDDIKNKSIRLNAVKRMDDYSRFFISIRLKLLDAVEVEGEKELFYHGDVSLNFECYIEKDYNNKWEKNAILKFLRTIYDYVFLRSVFTEYEKQIKEETYDIFNKTKNYLGG